MDNKPTIDRTAPVAIPGQTAPADAVATEETVTPATEEATTTGEEASENSSSTTEETEDLAALIEAERKSGKPDPEKARERFLKKRQEESGGDDDFEPQGTLTREEVEKMIAERTREVFVEANSSQIDSLAASIAESAQEAELIKEVHKNRIFPAGMSLRDQLSEAHAIANYKRNQAKTAEMARKIQSQETAYRNTATTHRDPQPAVEPDMAPDLKASMQRAGYTYNGQQKRYEKKMPNGKTLVKYPNQQPRLLG